MEQRYELLYIVPLTVTERGLSDETERVAKTIEKHSGRVVRNALWERRRLAYPIGTHTAGFYVLAEFAAEPKQVAVIERDLRLTNALVRFQMVIKEKEAPPRPPRRPRTELPAEKISTAPVDQQALTERLEEILEEPISKEEMKQL